MDLPVTCQHCHKHYLIKTKFAGRKVKCRHCKHPMPVGETANACGFRVIGSGLDGVTENITDPLLNTLFEFREPAEEDTKEFDWLAPSDWQPEIKVQCHQCGQAYRAPEEMSGRSVRCRCCGAEFRVPEAESPTVTMFGE
jgi:hypothetical protein